MVTTRGRSVLLTPSPKNKRSRKSHSLQSTAVVSPLENDVPPHSHHTRTIGLHTLIPTSLPQRLPRYKAGQFVPCSHYGPLRHVMYADYFFCGACDLWEKEKALSSRISRTSRRYECTSKHTSYLTPTQRKQVTYYEEGSGNTRYKEARRKAPNNPILYDMPSRPHVPTCDNDAQPLLSILTKQATNRDRSDLLLSVIAMNLRLKEKVKQLENDLEKALEKNKEIGTTTNTTHHDDAHEDELLAEEEEEIVVPPLSPAERLKLLIVEWVSLFPRMGMKRKASILVHEVVFDDNFLGGILKKHAVQKGKEWVRDNVYTAERVLRAMDFAGGTLSYKGVELLRALEHNGKLGMRTMLPSTGALQIVAKQVQTEGDRKAPYTMITTNSGEGFEFELTKTMKNIFVSHSVWEVGMQRPLEISIAIDGSTLTKSYNIISCGAKMIDCACQCPITKDYINLSEHANESTTMLCQSRHRCFILKMIVGQESKETFVQFEDTYKWFKKASEEGPNNPLPQLKPLKVSATADMVAHQKALDRGGACKVKDLFCTYCACTSSKSFVPNATKCDRWCTEQHALDPNWRCYHHSITDEEALGRLATEVQDLERTLEAGLPAEGTSKIRFAQSRRTGAEIYDKNHICFNPETVEARFHYSGLLSKELRLRGLSVRGSLEDRRTRLEECLEKEHRLREVHKIYAHCSPSEKAFYCLMQAIPCILHGECRMDIKVITMLFREGIGNCIEGKLFQEVNGTSKARCRKYIYDMEEYINTNILGDANARGQFRFPWDEQKQEVTDLRIDNPTARAIANSLDALVEKSVTDDERKYEWVKANGHLQTALVILRKHDEYTNEEVISFQKDADLFFQGWMGLHGEEGATNYIHMMGSGHMADFMIRWKCLYRYSQQGWENVNAMIKTWWFRRTNHGGGVGRGGKGSKSRLLPIARWLQRRLIWMSGYSLVGGDNDNNDDNDDNDDNEENIDFLGNDVHNGEILNANN